MWKNVFETLQWLDTSQELDREIQNLPWMEESKRELESTLLSDKYKYSPQIPVIRDCLKEIFLDDIQYIRIVNRFLLNIEKLIDSYHDLTNNRWDKNSEQYKEFEIRFEWAKMEMFSYFTEYWEEYYDRLQVENSGKKIEEIALIWWKLEQKFIELLLQRIKYIPNKE